jgi:redox-sensitive bicupin YhaK (pirin superfamily)
MSKIGRETDHALFNTRQDLVVFSLSGEAVVNGMPFSEHSALVLEPGETAIITGASDATELIELALPNFL